MKKYVLLNTLFFLSCNTWSLGEPAIAKIKPITNEISNFQCTTRLPDISEKAKIDFIKKWSVFVAEKSFALKYANIDNQLKQLQFCFSNSGWNQFNQALTKSGNLNLITSHQLNANTHVVGPIAVNHHPKFSSWTSVVPLRVVYQNKNQKISQEMNVHLTINQLKNNQLAVIQIVGKPTHRNLPHS